MKPRATSARPALGPLRLPSLGPRARARWASYDPGVAQLVLVDQSVVPSGGEIAGWIDALLAIDGDVRAIRTGALFPPSAERFEVAGFHPVDVLALLELDLVGIDRRALAAAPWARRGGGTRVRIRRLRSRDHDDASVVDRKAFGDPWGYSADDLAEVRRATPHHRAVAVRTSGRVTGFAISGAAAGHGYLQRLAVDPDGQRRGYGTALVADSLAWMLTRRLHRATVNTGVDNHAALALYDLAGFTRLPERLHVMQLDLHPPSSSGPPARQRA